MTIGIVVLAALAWAPALRPELRRTRATLPRMEDGKFVRHNELEPGCAPLGVVIAGLGEDELEALADAIDGVFEGPEGSMSAVSIAGSMSAVPIAVLDQSDLRLKLRDVLATLPDRNFVLPDRPAQPRVPLVLLSGFSTVATSAAVRAIGRLGLRGGSDNVRPMFAAAVPNALDKPWTMLLEELEGDHLANPRAPEASE